MLPSHSPKSNQSDFQWKLTCSPRAKSTFNPIRNFVQNMSVKPNPEKTPIRLSVGDPTEFGNLPIPQQAVQQLSENILSGKYNGYTMSFGSLEARKAIADYFSSSNYYPIQPQDVLLTCGTAGAIELVLSALGDEGKNVLVPKPGFPLFQTIANSLGMKTKAYRLIQEDNWQVDLADIVSQIDHQTVAIIVNNPSNPCGSVYTKEHLQDIVNLAEKCKIPIIADEVYANMCFDGVPFYSVASQSPHVPILSLGSISKLFAAPGWRLGWVIVHDRHDILRNAGIIQCLHQLTMRMLVPSSPIQSVIPILFSEQCRKEQLRIMEELQHNANTAYPLLESIPGLRCTKPQGAMYMFIHLDLNVLAFENDVEFTETLWKEESVFVIPGSCFGWNGAVRIVLNAPSCVLTEACSRLQSFCERHSRHG
jgi:tyrosine aminotransferase